MQVTLYDVKEGKKQRKQKKIFDKWNVEMVNMQQKQQSKQKEQNDFQNGLTLRKMIKKDVEKLAQNFKSSEQVELAQSINKFYLLNEQNPYVKLDNDLSTMLFGQMVIIKNMNAFKSYLIDYFLYNHLVDPKWAEPVILINEKSFQAKYWLQVQKDIGVYNGMDLDFFIKKLIDKKSVVKRRKLKEQYVDDLFEQLGDDVQIFIE